MTQRSTYAALEASFHLDCIMKVGIAGFCWSGKSTVFQWLTLAKPDPGKAQQGQLGKPEVPDERLDWLSAHFKPKKTTAAKIEFLDTPGLSLSERKDNPRRLAILRDAAACSSSSTVLPAAIWSRS